MKKVFKSNDFIIAFILVSVVSAASFVALSGNSKLYSLASEASIPRVGETSEIFWDLLPRQLINAIFIVKK
ncbi:MAG: hypothetical protein NVS1B13_10740 [Flavisolibacter sp.]